MTTRENISIDVQRQTGGGADALRVVISINPESLRLRETQMGARVFLNGWQPGGRIGQPGYPTRTFWIALPEGMEVAGPVRVEVLGEHAIDSRSSRLAPARPLLRDTPHPERQAARKLRRAARPGTDAAPPVARLAGSERIGPARVALLEVNPLVARASGPLRLMTGLAVTLPLSRAAAGPKRPAAAAPAMGRRQRERLTELARTVVVNPADVPALAPTPRDLGEQVDYVILTDDIAWDAGAKTPRPVPRPGMTAAFQALADWKTRLGLRARVVTITQIVGSRPGIGFGQDFAGGARDLQEAIRNFLRWALSAWGTAYVLLGGSEEIVPIRRLAIGDWSGSEALEG